MNEPRLGPRFDDALLLARRLHASQTRKGTDVPYIAHLLGVASIVLEDGGDEDEAIAALLHDAIEDQELEPAEIEGRFGARVRDIVVGCSDALQRPKGEWQPRKEKYLAHLREAPPDVLRVSAADKLHNARQILADYRIVGEKLWERFTGGREGTLWYYDSVVEILGERKPGAVTCELARVVAAIRELAGSRAP